MAITDVSCVKQQTIRVLVSECRKLQGEITEHLKKSFARSIEGADVECESRPSMPNVLDEIIEDLRELANSQKHMIDFIVTRVSPKL